MYKRTAFVLLISLAAVSLLMGAGEGESVAPSGAEDWVDVSIGFSMNPLDDEMGRFIQDKFKMNIEVVSLEDDALKLLAATGGLPDTFSTWPGIGDPLFNALIRDGLVRDIPDALLRKYPALKIYTESVPEVLAHRDMVGKLYMIPRRQATHKDLYVIGHGVWYRADWAKRLKLDAPTTVDELYEMLRAFTYDDPDNNGVRDTIGVTGWIWQIHYMPWVDIYNWIEEDGEWIPGYISDDVIPALRYWNKLYKEGLLDPEFAVANARNLFYQGKNGVLYSKASPYWSWRMWTQEFAAVNPDVDALEAVKLMPPPKKDKGSPAMWPAVEERQATLFNSNVDDTKLERIFRLYEWTLSDEGRDFVNYGFLGKDWEIQDGKAASLLPFKDEEKKTRTPLFEIYPAVSLFNYVSWGVTAKTPGLNPFIPVVIEDLIDRFQTELYGPVAVKPDLFVNSIMTPAKEKYNVGEEDAEEQFMAMITSDDPIEQFEAYRKKLLNTMGLRKVIEEVNQAAKEQGR